MQEPTHRETPGRGPIFLCGASVRAAACSALRAGWTPYCADLFADADLAARCSVTRLPRDQYPWGFPSVARQAPPGPWMYTGGLENYPRLLQRISQDRPLLGNDARTCYAVRDPERLAVFCQQAGVAFPRMERSPHTLPRDGTWLCKPYRGAGGTRIHRFHGLIPPGPHRTYFQQLVQGASLAMVFLQTAAGVELRGVTRQLVGADWLHSAPFAYCGSVGPVEWPPDLHLRWTRFGTQLAQHFGLKGVFGVDCIQGDDTHWLIEINPRYTASMEILEWALHRGVLGPSEPGSPPSNEVLGKAIYHARNSCRFPAEGPWLDSLHPLPDVWQMPEFADIPRPGTMIEAGQPVLTFYGRAASAAACEEQLRKRAALLDRLLSPG